MVDTTEEEEACVAAALQLAVARTGSISGTSRIGDIAINPVVLQVFEIACMSTFIFTQMLH